jgi:hypothetical protein
MMVRARARLICWRNRRAAWQRLFLREIGLTL